MYIIHRIKEVHDGYFIVKGDNNVLPDDEHVTPEKVYDSIGGGAVEFAAIDEAKICGHVMIKEYYLNSKDSGNLGMICGGSNKVLFIPV